MAVLGRLAKVFSIAGPLGLALGLGAPGCTSFPVDVAETQIGNHGQEIRFVARETEGDRAVWHTDQLLIEQAGRPDDLVFILENPTTVEHAFIMPEAKLIARERVLAPESSVDVPHTIRIPYVEPLAVRVKPGETKRIRVSGTSLSAEQGKRLRFFCSIHKDIHQSGALYVL